MKIRLILFFSALFICLSWSCQKENVLRNGGFTAKVNGKRWKANNFDFKASPYEARFLSDSALSIRGSGSVASISLYIKSSRAITAGEYPLNNDYSIAGGTYNDYETLYTYRTTSSNPGVVRIKEIDRTNKIIIGTFDFDAFNEENGETVSIKDGAFNIEFKNK